MGCATSSTTNATIKTKSERYHHRHHETSTDLNNNKNKNENEEDVIQANVVTVQKHSVIQCTASSPLMKKSPIEFRRPPQLDLSSFDENNNSGGEIIKMPRHRLFETDDDRLSPRSEGTFEDEDKCVARNHRKMAEARAMDKINEMKFGPAEEQIAGPVSLFIQRRVTAWIEGILANNNNHTEAIPEYTQHDYNMQVKGDVSTEIASISNELELSRSQREGTNSTIPFHLTSTQQLMASSRSEAKAAAGTSAPATPLTTFQRHHQGTNFSFTNSGSQQQQQRGGGVSPQGSSSQRNLLRNGSTHLGSPGGRMIPPRSSNLRIVRTAK
eukprot:PhM_4_TR14086/c4_g1_i2/m.107063